MHVIRVGRSKSPFHIRILFYRARFPFKLMATNGLEKVIYIGLNSDSQSRMTWNTDFMDSLLTLPCCISQYFPVRSGRQAHVYPCTSSTHVAPFIHMLTRQSSMLCEQSMPVNPASQSQIKSWRASLQLPFTQGLEEQSS